MGKKWDTVIPADLKRLCKWDIYVPLVTKWLRKVFSLIVYKSTMPQKESLKCNYFCFHCVQMNTAILLVTILSANCNDNVRELRSWCFAMDLVLSSATLPAIPWLFMVCLQSIQVSARMLLFDETQPFLSEIFLLTIGVQLHIPSETTKLLKQRLKWPKSKNHSMLCYF
jgi:hypothetical protein